MVDGRATFAREVAARAESLAREPRAAGGAA